MSSVLSRLRGDNAPLSTPRVGTPTTKPGSVAGRLFAHPWLRAWGRQGLVALALLILCPVFYLEVIVPAQEQRDAQRHRALALSSQRSVPIDLARRLADSPAEQLSAFYKRLPAERSLPDALEKIFATADKHSLGLNEGEYKLSREKAGKIVRFQLTLPLKSSYPQIRQFLAELLQELPMLALENIQFDRQRVADAEVEVKVRLVLFLEQT